MAVAFDAAMTGGNSGDGSTQESSAVQTVSSTGITLGGSASLLVVTLGLQTGAATPSGITVTWNGVSMSPQSTVTSGNETSVIFTLVNPATGNHTLTANWTTNCDVYMGAVSFSGTDTTTGINAADNATATNTTSLTVPSTTDGATVATFCANGSTPTVNFTRFWDDSNLGPGGAGTYHLAGTSNAHTFTSGGATSALSGVHIIAASGGADTLWAQSMI